MRASRVSDIVSTTEILNDMIKHNRKVECSKHAFGSNKRQYYLYFKPEGTVQKKIVVYIHGGSWYMFNPGNFKYIGQCFAEKGYHTISLGYRHTPRYKCQDLVDDIFVGYKAALEQLKSNGIDTSEVIVVGSSAGGHLGGVLSFSRRKLEQYGLKQSDIKAFVSIGGILYFGEPHTEYARKIIKRLFQKQYDEQLAEPYYLISGKEKIKTLCIHSKNDPVVKCENVEAFYNKYNKLQKDACEMFYADENKYLHSNLVAGIFSSLEKNNSLPLKKLFEFIEKI